MLYSKELGLLRRSSRLILITTLEARERRLKRSVIVLHKVEEEAVNLKIILNTTWTYSIKLGIIGFTVLIWLRVFIMMGIWLLRITKISLKNNQHKKQWYQWISLCHSRKLKRFLINNFLSKEEGLNLRLVSIT